jgi:hypothetical protein
MAVSRNTPGVENQHVRVGPSVRTNAHYGRPGGTEQSIPHSMRRVALAQRGERDAILCVGSIGEAAIR